MSRGFLAPTADGARIRLRVSPGAKRTSIEGAHGGDALKLRVAAPPVDGEANAEAERFLAERLGVRRSEVTVVQGAAGRDKTVRGAGVDEVRYTLSGRPA